MFNRISRSIGPLIALRTIEKMGSINRASEILNISQSALTRAISGLEKQLDVQILERSARGVRLTRHGKTLREHAERIESEINSLITSVEMVQEGAAKVLRLGATPMVSSFFVANGLAALYRNGYALGHVNIMFSEGSKPELLSKLRRNELDYVFSTLPFENDEKELAQISLFDLSLCVVVSASHRLAGRGKVRLTDIIGGHWVLPRADSELARRIGEDFSRLGEGVPISTVETSTLDATRILIERAGLIGILPERAIQKDLIEGNLISLRGDWSFQKRTVGIFCKAGKESDQILELIVDGFRDIEDQACRGHQVSG